MFNLLVKGMPWVNGTATFGAERVISYTDEPLKLKFANNGVLDFEALL
jgi:hypothetical protein